MTMRTITCALYFAAFIAQAQLSLAEGASADESAQDEVALGADGSFQKTSSIVRRQGEGDHHQHHHTHAGHHTAHPKAIFKVMDLNADGKVSPAEVKATAKKADAHIQKAMRKLLENSADNDDTGIDYEEFLSAVKQLKQEGHLHHVHEHSHRQAAVLTQNDDDVDEQATSMVGEAKSTTTTVTEPVFDASDGSIGVTCGGHRAPTCHDCPKIDAVGEEVLDKGKTWCNGECEWTAGEPGVCSPAGTATKAAVEPDLISTQITKKDHKVVNAAAKDAIHEANVEKAKKENGETDDNETVHGPWFYVIITFSVILGIYAIISIAIAIVFCIMSPPIGTGGATKMVDEEEEATAAAAEDAEAEDSDN